MSGLTVAVAIATPILAFAGAYGGQLLVRRSAKELETRSRREETLQHMRWAAELAASPEPTTSAMGVAQLRELVRAAILTDDELGFVQAALAVVIETPADQIDALSRRGDQVEVIDDEPVPEPSGRVPSEPSDSQDEEARP